MSDGTGTPTDYELLTEATHRLVRTVDALDDAALAGDSLLPGWSRAHVVAHLALNAEGLGRALGGLAAGEPTPIYVSPAAREADIETLAGGSASDLRARLLAATTLFSDAVRAVPEGRWDDRVERTPGGPSFPAHRTVGMRWREVEIHHVDLDAGYTTADWPIGFSVTTIEALAHGRPWETSYRVLARDAARTWVIGDDPEQTVSGPAADLAWWMTGRGAAPTLTTDRDALPEVPRW